MSQEIEKLKKLALSIKNKKKVRDTAPVYALAEQLGVSETDTTQVIKYIGL